MRIRELRAAVLTKLYETYKAHGARTWITDGLDAELGVPHGDSGMVIRDLEGQGLVERGPKGGARLTARGVEQIEEPGTEAHSLVSNVHHVQHVNIHGGNVQLGNHNQQTITYQTLLSHLTEQIERSAAIPEAEKRRWATTLKEIGAHPLTQTILQAAATFGATAFGK